MFETIGKLALLVLASGIAGAIVGVLFATLFRRVDDWGTPLILGVLVAVVVFLIGLFFGPLAILAFK